LEPPSLSVVLPNYNHARFLPEALGGLLAQSCPPLEIIVIDDASTDDSVRIIEAFQEKCPLIHLVKSPRNEGVIPTINKGLALARGDYVYSGASDDRAHPDLFEKSLKLLSEHAQAGLCSSLSQEINGHGEVLGLSPVPCVLDEPGFLSPKDVERLMMTNSFWVMANTTIYRREALMDAGGLRHELGSFTDGFIQRVLALKHGACFVPEPLASCRRLEEGYAASQIADIKCSAEILTHAEELMRTTYEGTFPKDYVTLWKQEWQYWTVKAAWQTV